MDGNERKRKWKETKGKKEVIKGKLRKGRE